MKYLRIFFILLILINLSFSLIVYLNPDNQGLSNNLIPLSLVILGVLMIMGIIFNVKLNPFKKTGIKGK